jgi:hypothetical protein
MHRDPTSSIFNPRSKVAEREGLPAAVRGVLRGLMFHRLAALFDPSGTQTLCSGSHPSLIPRFAMHRDPTSSIFNPRSKVAEREGLPSAVRGALRGLMFHRLAALFDPSGTQTLCSGSHPSLIPRFAMHRDRTSSIFNPRSNVADGLGSPRMVGSLLISWDTLGHWILRVAQNDRHRHVCLSEIRRKNLHSVAVVWMNGTWSLVLQVRLSFIPAHLPDW